MKTQFSFSSLLLWLLSCSRTTVVTADSYDVTDLFHIQVYGKFLGKSLSTAVSALIGEVTMLEFGLCFGDFIEVAPGSSIAFGSDRHRLLLSTTNHSTNNSNSTTTASASAIASLTSSLLQSLESSGGNAINTTTATSELLSLKQDDTEEEDTAVTTAAARDLSKIRSCPSNCNAPNNRKKCAYSNCATKGNRRRQQLRERRNLRVAQQQQLVRELRELLLFVFDKEFCEAAITLKLRTVFTLLNLNCVIDVIDS